MEVYYCHTDFLNKFEIEYDLSKISINLNIITIQTIYNFWGLANCK